MRRFDLTDTLKGDTYKGLQVEVLINGSPKDLTDTSITCEFRKGNKTGTLAKRMEVGNGITKTFPLLGKFTLDAFLADLEPATYFYDIQFTDGDVVSTYVGGEWKVKQDTTQP